MSQNTGFYGREQELADLWELWELATKKDGKGNYVGSPQMKIILGETGLGKSRLVQAFYEQLSSHPEWDPKDHNYWPDFFNDRDNQLHVNPISKNLNADHNPQGAPKFLWFGSRWQSEEERNKEERICVIPHLREILDVHVKIAVRNSPIWLKMRRVSGKIVKSYDISDAADFGEIIANFGDFLSETIPFANLIKKSYETGEKELNSQASVGRQQDRVHQEAADILLEEMHYVFGGFGSGGLKLPTVLWLDDAQWIDGISQQFVHQLWEVAKLKKWPLLILITHWEREWNILKEEQNQRDRSLLIFGEHATVLTPAESGHLREYLDEKLPGLKADQINLLIEKANGNFLSLVENVGYLKGYQELFVDEDPEKALANHAIDKIKEWESDRQRRIEQRFRVLKSSHKKLLGWSSEAGEQFLKDILVNIAKETLNDQEEKSLENLEQCVDPYAILGRLNPNLYNFRDRAYYRQACRYFDMILKPKLTLKQKDSIDECWRKVVIEWINNSFDGQGNLIDNDPQNGEANERRITSLEVLESQKLLETCLPKLPIPLSPDWNNPYDVASFRMRYLLITIYKENGLYVRISGCTNNFDKIEWEDLSDTVLSVSFLNNLVRALILAGDYASGIKLAKRCVDISKQNLGSRHPETATSLNNLALLMHHIGKYEEAEPLYRRSMAIREESLGPKHHLVADSLNNLAELMRVTGNYKEAEPLYRRSLSIYEKSHGPGHTNVATSLNNLAQLLRAIGNYKEAEPLYRRSLAIIEESLGPTHPTTASSLYNLAHMMRVRGNYEEAESLFRRSLDIQEESLGSEHHKTATSLNNLAFLLHKKGDYEEAEPLFRRSLAIIEKSLGPSHPDTAGSLNNLAQLMYDSGNYKEAEPLYRRSLAIIEESLGPTHPTTAISLNNLASLLQAVGNNEEAESLYRRSLAIIEESLGPSHPTTADSLNNLASLLRAVGNNEEAETLYHRSLDIVENTLGPRHPETAASLYNLAELMRVTGNYKEAEPLYRRSLSIYEKSHGPGHPSVATSLNNLAQLMYDSGNYKEAEPLYRRSLAIIEESLGPTHPTTAISLNNLASLLQAVGNNEEAESLYRRSLAIKEESLDPTHPSVASSLNTLAALLYSKGHYGEAEPLYRRSLDICKKNWGMEHPNTVTLQKNLAALLRAMGNDEEAESILRRVQDVDDNHSED